MPVSNSDVTQRRRLSRKCSVVWFVLFHEEQIYCVIQMERLRRDCATGTLLQCNLNDVLSCINNVDGDVTISSKAQLEVGPAIQLRLVLEAQWSLPEEDQRRLMNCFRRPFADVLPDHCQSKPGNIFRRAGDHWELQYDGGDHHLIPNRDGCLYLQELLTHPGSRYTCQQLYAIKNSWHQGATGRPSTLKDVSEEAAETEYRKCSNVKNAVSVDQVLDGPAIREYEKRLKEIAEELDEAKEFNDEAAMAQLENEAEMLAQQITGSRGPHGRLCRGPSAEKRNYDKVHNAIARAVSGIAAKDKALGEHLRRFVTFESGVIYEPEDSITWN